MILLDASAVLALARGEPGSEIVVANIETAEISAVNLSEVIAKLMDWSVPPDAARLQLDRLNLPTIPFDREIAVTAGLLRAQTREHGLSFGDRACLATASTKGHRVLTADRKWAELNLNIDIKLIR